MTKSKAQTIEILRGISSWRFGRNMNDYRLPSRAMCSDYLAELLEKLLKDMGLYLTRDGLLYHGYYNEQRGIYFRDWTSEQATYSEMETRIRCFIVSECFR